VVNSFDYSQYYYKLKEIWNGAENVLERWEEKETLEPGNSSV